jgi:hypothetical protein
MADLPPAVIDATWAEHIGLPPRPLPPQQRIANPDGTPTFEFNFFLTQQYEWERRLLAILTATEYPPVRP